MGMFRIVNSTIKSVTKETVKVASKLCRKCGRVLGLEEKECNCEREGKTNTRSDNNGTTN